ncbi:DUF4362 domain-containing protein [Paenibacillus tarimensis]
MKILLLLPLIISLISCSSSYNSKEAIERGDIVDLHGIITNTERLDKFIENIKNQEKDNVRITRYTIEGDPIFYDFTFNGTEVKYKYDNSNDQHGKRNVRSTVCKALIKNTTLEATEYRLEECVGKNAEVGNNFRFIIQKNH